MSIVELWKKEFIYWEPISMTEEVKKVRTVLFHLNEKTGAVTGEVIADEQVGGREPTYRTRGEQMTKEQAKRVKRVKDGEAKDGRWSR